MFKISPYSAESKTWHVRETFIELPRDTRAVKAYAWSHSLNQKHQPVPTQRKKPQLMKPPPSFQVQSCIINQLSCHRAVNSDWLSTAHKPSTNTSFPSYTTTDNDSRHPELVSPKTAHLTQKRENGGNYLNKFNTESLWALEIWELAADSHSYSTRLRVETKRVTPNNGKELFLGSRWFSYNKY